MMGVRLEVKTRGNPGDYSLWSLTKYVFNGCPLTTITTYHWPHFPCLSLWLLASIASYYMMWKWLLALSHLVLGAGVSHVMSHRLAQKIFTARRVTSVCRLRCESFDSVFFLFRVWKKRSETCQISVNKKRKKVGLFILVCQVKFPS